MLKHKQSGMPAPQEKAAAPSRNVVNLMDALRKSVEAGKPAKKRVASPPTQPVQLKTKKRARA